MVLSANWDDGFDMDTFPLSTGPHPLAYFMHWTAVARKKKVIQASVPEVKDPVKQNGTQM